MTEGHPTPHAQARAYIGSSTPPPLHSEYDVPQLRKWMREQSLANRGELERIGLVEDVDAGGVSARLYKPLQVTEENLLIWIHGGSWMSGDLDSYEALARALANRARCLVLAVDYRLAPEHRYPAAVEDCWTATEWAVRRFRRVAVGGDSAGGNIAAAVALRARDRDIALALQLLVYPVLDYAAVDGPAYEEFKTRYQEFAGSVGVGAEHQRIMRFIWEAYVPKPKQRADQDASPLRAASLAGLARAIIILAEHDILRAEGRHYADRLRSAAVPVEVYEYLGQVHGFFHLLGIMDDAADAVEKSADALQQAFAE